MSIITNSSLINGVTAHKVKILRSRIGQEKNAQNELMNLLYLVRTNVNCLRFDLYRSGFNLINRRLENSIFIVKENWRDSISPNDYETGDMYHAIHGLKETLFEEETNYLEISAYNNMTDKEYADSIVSCIKIDVEYKEPDETIEEIFMCIEKWKAMLGFLKCELYRSIYKDSHGTAKESANSFYIEQVWEDSQSFNQSEIYKFKISASVNTEIYVMNMLSVPTEPITKNAVLGDPALIAGLRKLNEDFGELCVNASAIPWGKNLIDQKTKSLIAISIDVVEQITGKPFENHISMALKQGATREELEELLLFMAIYAGFNKAGVFYAELDRIFGKR